MTDHETIHEALAAFQGEMPTVPKNKTAVVPTKSGGQYSYRYADLVDVTVAALPLLLKHGIAFTARPRRTEDGGYELAGVLMHNSGQTIEGALPIHGRDMQSVGSSLTYARRYLLGCLTGIVTDEDDDGQASMGTGRTTAKPTDWKALVDTIEGMANLDKLRELWHTVDWNTAPEYVHTAFNDRAAALQAS